MLMRFCIPVLLTQPKINQMDYMWFFVQSNQKILRFDIPMNVIFSMQPLDSCQLNYQPISTNWSANINTVFRLNFLLHIANKSSIDGPIKSITRRFDLYSLPCQCTFEKPTPPYKFFRIFDSAINCNCFDFSSSYVMSILPSSGRRPSRCCIGWPGRPHRKIRCLFWGRLCTFLRFCPPRTTFFKFN